MKSVYKITISVLFLLMVWIIAGWILLPRTLFSDPYATVVFSANNQLLGARIAADGQWRFPSEDTIPEKFKKALLLFEDRYFYQHPGFNPVSIGNALIDNYKAGRVVRGGSTLTQQVIRISRKGQPRTVWEKCIEMTLSVALECRVTKDDILQYFTDHAPMGGNVVGIEAASWRYFGHPAYSLSWAEAATLAVLPNAPSLINPGRNRHQLLSKRNRLLNALLQEDIIDSVTYIASKMEPLPEKPFPLPELAMHLVDYCLVNFRGQRKHANIDFKLQEQVNSIVSTHQRQLSGNGIHNAAVLVVSVKDNKVVAYVGNSPSSGLENHQQAVDMIRANRSTGSILKPLLYAGMLEEGLLLPNSLIADIPSYYNNYHPTNFDNHFSGSVPASEALSRSLNVPAIFMLRDYGQAQFLRLMEKTGITSFRQPASHYGLSMILGGGEASLWELVGMYAGMARTVLNYDQHYGRYTGNEYLAPQLFVQDISATGEVSLTDEIPLHAASIWLTYQSLKKVNRPASEIGWESFSSSKHIAWKTGTSYGFRDAWAIGTTADYIVGVWVGNADGEGRSGLTGTSSAAPVMFDVFHQLETYHIFYPPWDELIDVEVCHQSGFKVGPYCTKTDTIQVYLAGAKSQICPYHQRVFTDSLHLYRLSMNCSDLIHMFPYDCFVLPPVQEWYYSKDHPLYKGLPPWKPDCNPEQEADRMKFIYPISGASIYLPRGTEGKIQEVVVQLSHREQDSEVFWHLDDSYIGTTKAIHQMALSPHPGHHRLTVVDETGASVSVQFTVVER